MPLSIYFLYPRPKTLQAKQLVDLPNHLIGCILVSRANPVNCVAVARTTPSWRCPPMKRIALLAAIVLLTACGSKSEEAPAAEAEAPAAMDSTAADSTAATDSAATPM
jgi:hypothetical protein